ncbi:MAG: ATP-dependent RNA helicase HrpA [Acidimicrobiia bacterium]|nr:ATP-dependent RNA helicase HrpA [Acidimicrobiia bacterium]
MIESSRLSYPDSLPISERHDELLATIRDNQVVIVAGETGSGKSTQLPKLCLEAGRGVAGVIGHTQPRRVAARTIAERVAEEVGSPLGTDVGYTVRFTDKMSDSTLVRVMTDGILLAEIQRDRMLRRYDTLIIDEAHERSLNIDFILGYLRELLPERPDLKVIVTSATIDTGRFARHFATGGVPAPVVEVTGRTHPVELRYRPFGREFDVADARDQVQAILDAVDELADEGPGDVLVFLSGEREIHDAADALRESGRSIEVLPLYARLSAPEQHRIFRQSRGGPRRVVLSTNVAETSVTVPGIRYVVDAGTARISRYSRRLKVQRLPIEPVSQASANQRAGRCGRVAPGICIRLYTEEDFEARDEFTEPEILRTNLAAVILQMTAIGLGDVARFPFLEPPDAGSIRDGYALLEELSAITPAKRLTKTGRRLARLPIDPRLGRMILESGRLGCVREVLVIAAALSMQDVRERPADRREQADELHRRFDVPGSDLLSIVALWDHLRDRQRELSGNAFRRLCRTEYINYLRVREWVDLYSQLRRVAGDLGLRPSKSAGGGDARPEDLHRAVLTGLLSHIGVRDRRTRDFQGARNARFVIAPGSVLTKRPPEWVMAAELVETNRLYARRCAAIEPEWAEQLGKDLVKRSYGDPRWDREQGRALATERVTLYGLPLVSDRAVGYDRADEPAARAWFVTKALVEREWDSRHQFLRRNAEFLERLRRMTDRVRAADLIDDELLFDFYDERVPDEVTSGRHFDRWWKDASTAQPQLLDLTENILEDHLHIRPGDYPDVWRQGDIELPLTYRFAPGEPLDGVTVHIPLAALNQIRNEGFDWQIPGFRRDRAEAMVRSLPKSVRRALIPLAESTERALGRLDDGVQSRPLVEALAEALAETSDVEVRPGWFDGGLLPDELTMHFVVSDHDGEVMDVGTDLSEIKRRLAPNVRESIAAASAIEERRGIVDWDLGELPLVVESFESGLGVVGYPTLLDVGASVALRVVSSPELQARAMRGGVRRLLILNAAPTRAAVERLLTSAGRLALAGADIPVETIVDDCIGAAVDAAMRGRELPWNADDWTALRTEVRAETPALTRQALTKAASVVAAAVRVQQRLGNMRASALADTVDDANRHLGRLVRPGFVSSAGLDRLDDVERYVDGIEYRLDHLAGAVDRDGRRMEEVRQLERRFDRLLVTLDSGRAPTPEMLDVGRALEEFRISVFAQPLGARGQVSAKRLRRDLTGLEDI